MHELIAFHLSQHDLDAVPWHPLQPLLDACCRRSQRDVFSMVVGGCHRRQRPWFAIGKGELRGIVMLCFQSKVSHLDNLAGATQARGEGVGHPLVKSLLAYTAATRSAMLCLTTCIPQFFVPLGFLSYGQLADGSTAMLISYRQPITSIHVLELI
jgi:hypothetical protein